MPVVFHPRVWLNGLMPALTPFESRILRFVIDAEKASHRPKLLAQINSINFVQRHSKGREVYFYRIENGLWRRNIGEEFILPDKEWLWAKIAINNAGKERLIVEVFFLNGRLGSMTFNRPLTYADEKNCDLRILRINSLSAIKREIQYWSNELPSDLNEFVKDTVGAVPKIVFIPPENTYEVELPEGKFINIGEVIDIGAILVASRDNKAFSGVYLGAYDGLPVKFLGESCAAAVKELESA